MHLKRIPLEPVFMGFMGFALQFLGLIWLASGQGMGPQQWILIILSLFFAEALGQHLGKWIPQNLRFIWALLACILGLGALWGLPNLALSHPLLAWILLLVAGILLNLPLARVWRSFSSKAIGWVTLGELLAIWGLWLLYPLVGWQMLMGVLAILCVGIAVSGTQKHLFYTHSP